MPVTRPYGAAMVNVAIAASPIPRTSSAHTVASQKPVSALSVKDESRIAIAVSILKRKACCGAKRIESSPWATLVPGVHRSFRGSKGAPLSPRTNLSDLRRELPGFVSRFIGL